MAAEFGPDVVLLDVMMPGIDGYETCRRLRALPRPAGPPKIIMVSARAMVEERLRGYEAGADDYVVKPFDEDELLAKVRVYARLQSLEQLERLRESLLSLLQHETRTPITCLLAAAEALRDAEQEPGERRELLEAMGSAAQRLDDLIGRIVLLGTLRTGPAHVAPETADLAALVASAVESLRADAEAAGVALETDLPDEVPALLDARFGELVVTPLLRNAVRFTRGGGRVRVGVSTDPGWPGPLLTIEDDGRLIERELVPHVLEGLMVGDVEHHGRGTGLSLPIARLFVQAHGGRFQLTGEPGEGTCVRLWLSAPGAGEAKEPRAA